MWGCRPRRKPALSRGGRGETGVFTVRPDSGPGTGIPGPRDLTAYFWDRIHFTIAFRSASDTAAFGGIGT
jgi:hypothetical protein